jgi:hypothetical protein
MSIRFRALVCSSVVFVAAATAVLAQTQTPSPAGAGVYFINLKDGDALIAGHYYLTRREVFAQIFSSWCEGG